MAQLERELPSLTVADGASTLQGTPCTFAEYVRLTDSLEGVRTEWVNQQIEVYTVGNNLDHLQIMLFLSHLFDWFVQLRGLGRVFLAGLPMYLGDDKPSREPDVMVVLNAHLSRIHHTYLDGCADVVVEIVSPESDERDHWVKFTEYEAAGVPEYWLIDPIRREADVYVRGADGYFHRAARDSQNRLLSQVLAGFALAPETLWQTPPPGGRDLIRLIETMNPER